MFGKKRIGVFLARLQPVHNAHLYVIKQALLENDEVYVIVGSANKKETIRNPFSIALRRELLKLAIEDEAGIEAVGKLHVLELADWSTENDVENQKEWGNYLYYNIVSRIGQKDFTIYYSDEPEIMLNWFEDRLKEKISFRFLERNGIFDGLSATKIRQAFGDDNKEYIEKFCPAVVVRNFYQLKSMWMDVKNSPKDDFSMK
jgi:cytidyltransferase-like protein